MAEDDDRIDIDPETDRPPLADLVDRIAGMRNQSRAQQSDIWEQFPSVAERDTDDLWEKLNPNDPIGLSPEADTDLASTYRRYPSQSAPEAGVGGLSTFGQIMHGYILSIILLLAFLIVATTISGLLPSHLWVLSLPLFAIGVLLLVPVLAWEANLWDPRQIR